MRPKIIFIHWNKEISAGITDDHRFFWRSPEGALLRLVREYYAGGLYYRIPGTSTRFSRKRLTAAMRPCRISYYLPAVEELPF